LTETVDAAHAPRPTNDSERLLFRQLYDTLVRVDCAGIVRPGLAASWRLDPTGRTWVVTLDERARFSSGDVVTATDVVSSWSVPGGGGRLHPEVRQIVESAVPVNRQVIGITLRTSGSESPRALADARLAIATSGPGPWPLGTTALRVLDRRRAEAAGVVTIALGLVGVADDTVGGSESVVRFLVTPGADSRDRLDEDDADQQIDLLVSSDPAVLAYADAQPTFISVPLPWRRTHVLLSLARASPNRGAPPTLSLESRQALADDAVRQESRGAEGPFWWESLGGCGPVVATRRRQAASPSRRPSGRRIVFRASDPVSRDLVGRLVGLTAFDDPHATALLETLFPAGADGLRGAGLDDAAFDRALGAGGDRAYVVRLARQGLDPCAQLRAFVGRAAWVGSGAAVRAVTVPLVDTRARAVVRRGRIGLTVDHDGMVVLAGARGARP